MKEIIEQFLCYVDGHQSHDKRALADDVAQRFQLMRQGRSVYACRDFAVRFSQSQGKSATSTVLAVSTLRRYDDQPFFVALVDRTLPVRVLLANSTFLKKVSHSSQRLSTDRVRGSFNANDILREYGGMPNDAEHVAGLFPCHRGFSWEENLARLVEATHGIVPRSERYEVDAAARQRIYNSVGRAIRFIASPSYKALADDLSERVQKREALILKAAQIDNVNVRGRLIEAIITVLPAQLQQIRLSLAHGELPPYDVQNDIGDYHRTFDEGDTVTDIKTKVVWLDSNPKAYNVDKFLALMADERSVFFLFFVGIEREAITSTALCSVYHRELLTATIVQRHWAGRATRGVTQLVGKKIEALLRQQPFTHDIDAKACRQFLDMLIRME